MARPLQRRKNNSSIPKKRQKTKSKKQILSNPIIAANWNSEETPAQNYRRLGLARQLNKSAGGKERVTETDLDRTLRDDPLAINPAELAVQPAVYETRIERDPETGAILRVLDEQVPNPLNDLLNELDDDRDINYREVLASNAGRVARKKGGAVETEVTRQLDEYAASGERRPPRNQSELEQQWVAKLVQKHGDDYRAMFWDKVLNPMQQSEGDLKRRVRKWQAKQR